MEEQDQEAQPLFFSPKDWMYSDTGYNLIAGVLPQYQSRRNILTEGQSPVRQSRPKEKKPVLLFVVMCITGALLMLVTLKAFPNLRLWVNIH